MKQSRNGRRELGEWPNCNVCKGSGVIKTTLHINNADTIEYCKCDVGLVTHLQALLKLPQTKVIKKRVCALRHHLRVRAITNVKKLIKRLKETYI